MRRIALKTLIIAALLIASVNAGEPMRIYIDDQLIGTVAELEYRTGLGEIHIMTHELVIGCQQAGVFRDRFEQW